MTRASSLYFLAQAIESAEGLIRCQIDDAAFRFRNDFVFDDENVTGCKGETLLH